MNTRPCTCDNYRPENYTPDQCRVCWLYHMDANYREHWEPTKLCRHLGNSTRAEPCSSCSGTVHIKVFKCNLFQQCTIGTNLPLIHCCKGCQQYQPKDDSHDVPQDNSRRLESKAPEGARTIQKLS